MLQLLQQQLPQNAVATEHSQCTLTATLTCSSHSGTASYEIYQRNLDVYVRGHLEFKKKKKQIKSKQMLKI